jgi:hypothetical protein
MFWWLVVGGNFINQYQLCITAHACQSSILLMLNLSRVKVCPVAPMYRNLYPLFMYDNG